MDIPTKFLSIEPPLNTIIKHFIWRRHPFLPEMELFALPAINNDIKKQLQAQDHSWQWPYIWECGIGLARWILDNPNVVKDKIVYDLGTGQGTVAIAAKMAGAKISIGIDTCVYSDFVLTVNSERNKVQTLGYNTTLFKAKIADKSIVFASDVVYGQSSSSSIMDKFVDLSKESTVIISQSGRTNPSYDIIDPRFLLLQEYMISTLTPGLENVETIPVRLYYVAEYYDDQKEESVTP